MASFGMYKPKSSVSFALRAIAEPARSKQNDKSHPVSQLSTFTPRLRHTRRIKSSSHSPHSSRRSIDRSIDAHEESESEKNARPDPLSDQIRTRPLIDPSSRSPTPPLLSTRRRIVTRIVHHSHIIRNKKNTRLTSNPHSNLNQIKITNPIESKRVETPPAPSYFASADAVHPFNAPSSNVSEKANPCAVVAATHAVAAAAATATRAVVVNPLRTRGILCGRARRRDRFRSVRFASRWRPNRPFVNRRSVKMGVRTCFDWFMCIVDVF